MREVLKNIAAIQQTSLFPMPYKFTFYNEREINKGYDLEASAYLVMWYEPFVVYQTIDVIQDSYTGRKNKSDFNRWVGVCNLNAYRLLLTRYSVILQANFGISDAINWLGMRCAIGIRFQTRARNFLSPAPPHLHWNPHWLLSIRRKRIFIRK